MVISSSFAEWIAAGSTCELGIRGEWEDEEVEAEVEKVMIVAVKELTF